MPSFKPLKGATQSLGSLTGGDKGGRVEDGTSEFQNKFKVSLRRAADYPAASQAERTTSEITQRVTFDVTPDVTETRQVNYKDMNPVHMPGTIYVYGNTSARTFALDSVKLISRTVAEATRNMQTLWTLRSWTMPHFGNSSTLGGDASRNREAFDSATPYQRQAIIEHLSPEGFGAVYGQELLGLPPPVLYLNAYTSLADGKDSVRAFATNIHRVPVVITNLTIPYPSDVDYIPTSDGQPIPRVMVLSIQLNETQAPRDMERFSIHQFRTGTLVGF